MIVRSILSPKYVARFWARTMVAEQGCWLWQGRPTGEGYSRIYVAGLRLGAHQVSYLIHVGDIPDNMKVCHTCDVRMCVRPDHLFLGTSADNSADMVQKGRSSHKVPGTAKLTERHVRAIRLLYRHAGVSQYELAARFGVKQPQISAIVNRKQWA